MKSPNPIEHRKTRLRLAPAARRAYLMTELLAALGLALAVVALSAYTLNEFARSYRENEMRRVLRGAAEAQLVAMRAGLSDEQAAAAIALPHSAELTIERQAGEGVWDGFTRVTITVRRPAPPRADLVVTLVTFMPSDALETP